MSAANSDFELRRARLGDEAEVLRLIQALAEYEKLAHEVVATEADLRRTLFGEQPEACLLYTSPSPRDRTRSRMPSSA